MNPARSFLILLGTLVACDDPPLQPDAPAVAVPAATRTRGAPRDGQVQGLAAPGAGLSARVPIVGVEGRDFATWWLPEVLSADGRVLYQDPVGFPARFNVYWAWDDAQRLWLYNTDDGGVWVYAHGTEGWGRQAWERSGGLVPPAVIAARATRP